MQQTKQNDLGRLIYQNDLPPQRLKPKTIKLLTQLASLFILASIILSITPRFFGIFELLNLNELGQLPRHYFIIALIISIFLHIKARKLKLIQVEVYENGLRINGHKNVEIFYDEIENLAPYHNLTGVTISTNAGEYHYIKSTKKQNLEKAVDKTIDAYVAHTGEIVHKTATDSVHGVTHNMTTEQLSESLHNDEMRKFESEFALTPEKEKQLLIGAYMTLYYAENESPKTLASKRELLSKVRLRSRWEIKNEATAHQILEATSKALLDAPQVEEFYQTLQIDGAKRLSELYLNDPDTYNNLVAELAIETNQANYDKADEILTTGFGYTEAELMGINLEDLPAHIIMISVVAKNIHDAHAFLKDNFNYTEEELANIKSLDALDLARPAYLAKVLLSRGILTEAELWPYIEKAAQKAQATYNNWREFIGAYVIGRTFMYNWIDPSDGKFYAVIHYLLNDPKSPYVATELK